MSTNPIEEYGWTAVPRSLDKLMASRANPQPSIPMKVADILLPETELAQQVIAYAKKNLPVETLYHSMRVYYYGTPFHHSLSLSEQTDHFTRTSNSKTTLPNLDLHRRNLPPRLPSPRHRNHTLQPRVHTPVLRVPRRILSARPLE